MFIGDPDRREVKPCDHLAVCKLKHSQLNIHGKISTNWYFSLVVVVSWPHRPARQHINKLALGNIDRNRVRSIANYPTEYMTGYYEEAFIWACNKTNPYDDLTPQSHAQEFYI